MTVPCSDPDRPDRRALLASALFAVAGSLPIVAALASDERVATIRALFSADLEAARALGELYLRIEPNERSANSLVLALFGEPSLRGADASDLAWVKSRLRSGRARDFEQGDLVILDGWWFARTEARLLALCAMIPVY